MKATFRTLLAALLTAAVFVPAIPAAKAEEAEPAVTDLAYYWEAAAQQQVETPNGTVTVETPNPFCPSAPSSLGAVPGTCAPERLPVWVQGGDYETPYMLSAVAFDLSLVPIGSEVSDFTVKLLEDESGCSQREGETPPVQCRDTEPLFIDGQRLQACVVNDLFGSGEARLYKEIPKHTCSSTSPIAERKEIKNDAEADPTDSTPDHVWTFDLTAEAQEWTKSFTTVTGVLLRPVKPKNEEDAEDEWRVVLAGPRVENGVVTSLKYEPGEGDEIPPIGGTDTGGTVPSTTGSSTDFTTTGSTGSFPSSSDSGSSFGDTTGTGEVGAPEDTGATELAVDEAAAEGPGVDSFPGYVWLAILAGIVAFSTMRSIIFDSVTGIRPNGALAQIRKLNAEKKGLEPSGAASKAGMGAAIGGGISKGWDSVKRLFGRKTSAGEG